MRKSLIAVGGANLATLLIGGVGASAAVTPATPGGVIHVLRVQADNGPAYFIFTGAFADAGVGHQGDIVLSRGSFKANTAALDKLLSGEGSFDAATCSFFIKATAPVTVYGGTGAYAGISGTVNVTATVNEIATRTSDGKCNTSNNAASLSTISVVKGSGTVSFK
jgi:hypothetical protein